MQTFSKLQRNISYQTYLKDFITISGIILLNSNFIYIPLFIGLFITLEFRLSFILPFLFLTEITHSYVYFSLIAFFFVFKKYIYTFFSIFLSNIIDYLSIPLIYILYFSFLYSYDIINNIPISINIIYIFYYILIEEFILIIKQKIIK